MAVIVVGGGGSTRMGFDKLLAPLGGKPVVWHAMRAFSGCGLPTSLVLVTRPSTMERMAEAVEGDDLSCDIVEGGEMRHHSVWNGMERATSGGRSPEWIAVHDAARPLVHRDDIVRCLDAAREHGAASCAHPVGETLKRATPDGVIAGAIDRRNVWAMETPQIFRTGLLVAAYRRLMESGRMVTDETSAVAELGYPVQLVGSRHPNPKITFPGDLELAEMLFQLRGREVTG